MQFWCPFHRLFSSTVACGLCRWEPRELYRDCRGILGYRRGILGYINPTPTLDPIPPLPVSGPSARYRSAGLDWCYFDQDPEDVPWYVDFANRAYEDFFRRQRQLEPTYPITSTAYFKESPMSQSQIPSAFRSVKTGDIVRNLSSSVCYCVLRTHRGGIEGIVTEHESRLSSIVVFVAWDQLKAPERPKAKPGAVYYYKGWNRGRADRYIGLENGKLLSVGSEVTHPFDPELYSLNPYHQEIP